jgi:hypothetical protein
MANYIQLEIEIKLKVPGRSVSSFSVFSDHFKKIFKLAALIQFLKPSNMYHSRLNPLQYCQTEIGRVQRQHVNFYSSRTDFHRETSKSLPSSWHLERAGLHKTMKNSPDELFLSVFRERKKNVN